MSVRRLLRWTLLACALVAALPAAAAPRLRVALAPVTGRARPALAAQLRGEICGAFTCVAWARVSTAGAPDAGKARRDGVAGSLVGVVGRQGGRRVLALSLFTRDRFATVTWRLSLDVRGRVPAEELAAVVRELSRRLGGAAAESAPAPPPVTAPAPPSPSAPPARAAPELPPPPARMEVVPAEPRAEEAAPAPLPARPAPLPARPALRPTRNDGPPWLALEVGALGGRRELRFEGARAAPAPLRDHVVPAFAGPVARVEVHPAAPLTRGLLAGVNAFASYASSIGIQTRLDGESHETRLWRLSTGAGWRTAPLGARRAAIAVTASYELRRATVRPAIAGLPDAELSGLRGGVGCELPLGRSLSLTAAAGYVRWLTARELVDSRGPFFPGGAAWALEAEAGLSVAISGSVSLALGGELTRTRYSLRPDPDGIYRADAASDSQLLGRVALRVIL